MITYEDVMRIRNNQEFCDTETMKDVAEMVTLAIYRQIPQQPTTKTSPIGNLYIACAECGNRLYEDCSQCYCDFCGQAIEWGNAE